MKWDIINLFKVTMPRHCGERKTGMFCSRAQGPPHGLMTASGHDHRATDDSIVLSLVWDAAGAATRPVKFRSTSIVLTVVE